MSDGRAPVEEVLFDAGCFAAQAANQSQVIAIDPERSGSLSSVYLVLYFIAGAIGTALAALLLAAHLGRTDIRHERIGRATVPR